MENHIVTAVLHGFSQACAGVIVVLILIALAKYRALR